MEKALAIQEEVQRILGTEEVYLVGGSVRDLVMGNDPKDYDFTTPMLPEDMVEKVKAAGRRVYTIGEKFGTIGFKVPYKYVGDMIGEEGGVWGDEPQYPVKTEYEYVEVTTFRSEIYTSKSRKPEVSFVTSLEEDLARRDFTMNAMVLRSDGTIYDPYGGKLDIYKKQIVTVGWPKDRIQEDPLRILRAARFASRYGFSIDPNFVGKARQLADRIFDVSVERWVTELDKLLTSEHSEAGYGYLMKMGVAQRIFPEISGLPTILKTTDANEAWKWLLNYSVESTDTVKEPSRVRRFVNYGICARFKFSNERTNFILDKSKKKV